MHEWVAILDEKQQGVMREVSVPGSRRLDRQRLEGIAVALMCTADPDVRRQALELLKTLRTLHRSLLASSKLFDSPAGALKNKHMLLLAMLLILSAAFQHMQSTFEFLNAIHSFVYKAQKPSLSQSLKFVVSVSNTRLKSCIKHLFSNLTLLIDVMLNRSCSCRE